MSEERERDIRAMTESFDRLSSLVMILGGWTLPPPGMTAPPQFAALANILIKKMYDLV
jgi:hypothetical protein